MKGIYLASYKAYHPNYNIVYQDINGQRDIGGDMLEVDLSSYDFIIATPPCNYWSRANYRRETSEYAQSTKHLLGAIIDKLITLGKPFIVENVRNKVLMATHGLLDVKCHIIEHGRHTYWTNIPFDPSMILQLPEFIPKFKKIGHKQFLDEMTGKIYRSNNTIRINNNTQGGDNVHKVIEHWLQIIGSSPLTMREDLKMTKQETKKVMTRLCVCKKSKAGNLYLATESNGKSLLVNLIKDNKRYTPKLKEGNSYDVDFTSYQVDEENNVIALFGVSGI